MYRIFTDIWLIFIVNVDRCTSPMDAMGYITQLPSQEGQHYSMNKKVTKSGPLWNKSTPTKPHRNGTTRQHFWIFPPFIRRLGFAKATVESRLFAMKNLNFQGCIFSGIMKWYPVWEDQTRNMYGNIEGISKCIFEKKCPENQQLGHVTWITERCSYVPSEKGAFTSRWEESIEQSSLCIPSSLETHQKLMMIVFLGKKTMANRRGK